MLRARGPEAIEIRMSTSLQRTRFLRGGDKKATCYTSKPSANQNSKVIEDDLGKEGTAKELI